MMNNIYNYFLEANICLVILGLFYYLFLKNDNHFRFNRFYLLGSIAISTIFPLIRLGSPFNTKEVSPLVTDIQNVLTLPEFTVFANQSSSSAVASTSSLTNWPLILVLLYASISLILFTVFSYQILQVFKLAIRKNRIARNDYILIPTDGQLPTFTFFNLLFFDNTLAISPSEKEKIIKHEVVHIYQKHSWDIVFLELMKAVFWINPVVWMLKQSIQHTHEYLADEELIRHTDADQYKQLLAKMALSRMILGIGHHFNQSFTLKRLKMMKKAKTKFEAWKWLSLIPVIVLLLVFLSCNDEVMTDVNEVMATATQVTMPPELQPELKSLQEKYPDADFIYMETDGTNTDELSRLQNVDPASIGSIRVWKDREIIGIILNKNGALQKIQNLNQTGDEVFMIVEDPATPQGGYKEFYRKIGEELIYPKEARKAGIEGKVFVQFVIDQAGYLTEIKVVKGLGHGMDEAAIKAIDILKEDQWKPAFQRGKAVRQRVILPITFKLGDSVAKISLSHEISGEKMQIRLNHDGLTAYGTVLDSEGDPISGVNILIHGTGRGTVSDVSGDYKIILNNNQDKLNFSHVSYKTEIHSIQ